MKIKHLLFSLVFVFCTIRGMAQKGALDIGLDVGYGFRAAPNTSVNHSDASFDNVTYSLGTGFNARLSGTYMLGEHIGAGLNLDYLLGMKTELVNSGNFSTTTTDINGSFFSVTPNVIITANTEKLNPYGRFGVVLGMANVTSSSQETGRNAANGTDITKFSGGLAMGWYAAFGAQYPLSGKWLINAEVFSRTMAYAPKKAENTQAYDGFQKAPTITYVKSTNSTTAPYTENQIYWPFSSVGIMIGIRMRLGGA